jgi:hypothetical protein
LWTSAASGAAGRFADGSRFARDKPRFTDTLDVMKFICKDIWIMVFKKQIDNLKTNHRVRLFALVMARLTG